MGTGDLPAQRASNEFVAEFTLWRVQRGLSKKQLAAAMGFDPSYVSHIEAGRHRPTEDFARRAEATLQAGGQLWRRFRTYEALRAGERIRVGVPARDPPVPEQWLPPGTGLICEREVARLWYADGIYRCTIRRGLYNAGTEPVTRYPIRIKVDRYPGEAERSNRHHRDHPLTWEDLALTASCAGEPMTWRAKTDRDADKEIWLLFANDRGQFPLYPGQRTTISYTYHVRSDKWGQWFQRAIRLPTRQLAIEVDLPAARQPVVWGMETSLAAEAMPLRTPVVREPAAYGRVLFSWHTDRPSLNALYRLEWRFGADAKPSASDDMRAAGIVQRGAEILTTPARRFDLPREAATALDVTERLTAALDRASALYPFVKGAGLAAPQIGLAWAAAVIRPAHAVAASGGEPATASGGEAIVLLNPRIVASSPELDEQYEGCLSFFDVRGLVARPLSIRVECDRPTGERVVETYRYGLARLVAHEIDHLEGRLYVDRMAPGCALVPLEEYEETGRPWRY